MATDRVTGPTSATHQASMPLREVFDVSTHEHRIFQASAFYGRRLKTSQGFRYCVKKSLPQGANVNRAVPGSPVQYLLRNLHHSILQFRGWIFPKPFMHIMKLCLYVDWKLHRHNGI